MNIGIAIDAWKLSIFERHLAKAGYAYTRAPGLGGTLMLSVETPDRAALLNVVREANTEAARTGPPP